MARSSATLMIDIAADIAKLRTGFTQAEKIVEGFGKKMSGLGRTVKVGLAGLGVGLGLNAVRQMAQSAGDIGESAEAVGLGVDQFQALTIAMKQAGVEGDKVASVLAKTATFFGKAFEGDKGSIETLEKLGVHLLDAQGNAVGFDQSLVDLAKAIDGIENPMEKVNKAREVFGKGGEKMIPVLAEMAKGFEHMRQVAELGIISPAAVKNLDAFFDRASVLSTFISTQFIEALNAVGEQHQFRKALKELDDAIVNLGQTMSDFKTSGWPEVLADMFAPLIQMVANTAKEINLLIGAINAIPGATTRASSAIRKKWLEVQIAIGEGPMGFKGPGEAEQIAKWKEELAGLSGGKGFGGPEPQTGLGVTVFGDKPKGTRNPGIDDKGAAAEKIAAILAKVREESAKATDALDIFQKKMEVPLDDTAAARQAEGLANIKARIREVSQEFKDAKLSPSKEQLAEVERWITSTEKAKIEQDRLKAVLETAKTAHEEFGNGIAIMREKIDQLTEAKARGIITAEEYAGAIKKVKEAQEDQQASQDQMKTGLDAIAAGFMNAMNKAGRANKEYEAGEKIFDSMVSGFGDAIEQLVTTGTIKFDELAKSFASMLARMAAELAARAVIMSILKAIAGGAGAGDVTAASPTATMQAYNTSAMDFKLPGFAAGGPVSAGQAIMVGENGPERFVPSVAGRIEPNSSLSREPSITINNNAPGVDVKAERGSEGDLLFTIEKVRAALTRDVRRGGNPFSVAMGQAYGMARAGR